MTSPSSLKTLLAEAAAAIRGLEAEAMDALHARNDTATHRARLAAKCELLMALPNTAAPAMQNLAPGEKNRVAAELHGFATRAGQATRLGSVFYMGALLYPDDYQEGEPNDLERFIATLG